MQKCVRPSAAHYFTERVGMAVTLFTRIRVLASNLGRGFLQATAATLPLLGHHRFLPNPLQLIYHHNI